jgi:hypothetical protein
MPITRTEAAVIFATHVDDKRGSKPLGLYSRAWAGSGAPTEQLVRVYITERKRKKEKRFGKEVDVQRDRDIGYVQIDKDGRVWLSNVLTKLGRIASMLDRSIGGVEVDTDDGPKPIRIMKGRRQIDD